MSATVRRLNIPALFTRMSMRPNRSVAERTISPHARKSPTSPAVIHDRRSPISFAPAPPSMTAMARPIPLEAPVTIATESLISVVLASITDSFGVFDSHFSASLDSPGAQDRASQARCPALGLQGDLISLVRTDSTAGVLESFLRDGISLEHDAVPRAHRQDIRGHPVELPVRNLDEIEPKFFQSHVKGDRQKPRIDDSQILVDEDLAVIYPRLLPVPFHMTLKKLGFDFIEVPDGEFDRMAPNVLAVGPRDCIMLEGNPITKERLEDAGCRVRTYHGDEISMKAEGGATCLTRPVLRAR